MTIFIFKILNLNVSSLLLCIQWHSSHWDPIFVCIQRSPLPCSGILTGIPKFLRLLPQHDRQGLCSWFYFPRYWNKYKLHRWINERFIPIRVFRCYNKIFLFLGHIYIYLALATNAGRKHSSLRISFYRNMSKIFAFLERKIYRFLHKCLSIYF